ncbi:helix-turn-helix transcriptional regulator [Kibdelosporangium aridum]|uniref:Regulatory protein, luxR family n=1 Tax=Kibdelosporangium aridum TaxID=2030 RepID=A0A1W2FWS3_KIBAR|nr:LuxR family transcriptional regulator [Kibdelosporangium aridum]SMD26417.1 regulatory protein, luxR family [Kibdelosporangium aridum]
MTEPGDVQLLGREHERERLHAFLDEMRHGGASLIVSGEPGIGKSALVADALRRAEAEGILVLQASGVEYEADVSFSCLNQALLPVLDQLDELTPALAEALRVALGFGTGAVPERLMVCNAALSLLRRVAQDHPVLIALDDMQWVDRASAAVLTFIARRLKGIRIGFLAAVRTEAGEYVEHCDLPALVVEPLDQTASAELMDSRFPSLRPRLRERLLAEAQGNPLAILELPSATFTTASPSPTGVVPLTARLQALFESRIGVLPDATRQVLLVAVLDGTGDLRVLERACRGAMAAGSLDAAERAQLITVDDATARLAFRHPLIRSALVEASTHTERRQAHELLAEALPHDVERRAWHLAEAAIGPDATVAQLLHDASRDMLSRGDSVGAVSALTRAAELSVDGSDRSRRLAEAAYIGAEINGDLQAAQHLLADARRIEPDLSTSLLAACAAVFLMLNEDGHVTTAHRLLVAAIENGSHGFSASDGPLVEAMHTLLLLCWFGGRPELWEPFYRALNRMEPAPPDVLAYASKTFPDPVRTAVSSLPDAPAIYASLATEPDPTRVMRIGTAAVYVDRLADCRERSWVTVRQGRDGGPTRRYIGALKHLCLDAYLSGRWDEQDALADEALDVCAANGFPFFSWYFWFHKGLVAAVRGQHDIASEWAGKTLGWAASRGVHSAEVFAHHVEVLSALGQGDLERAYEHATAVSPPGVLASHVPHATWVMYDLVESATRLGRAADADAHVQVMREADVGAISPRMLMLQRGAAALVAPDDEAVELFRIALSTPSSESWPFERARIELAYGERLRRMRLVVDAREPLLSALDVFQRLGAHPWVTRTRTELRATGHQAPRAPKDATGQLTAQELEIAKLAAGGLSNKEIGAKLFLSHRTVGSHLYKTFPKLGITSRAALRDALATLDNEHELQ